MKLPFLPLHILTTKKLAETKAKARAEGRRFSQAEVKSLLHKTARVQKSWEEMRHKLRLLKPEKQTRPGGQARPDDGG